MFIGSFPFGGMLGSFRREGMCMLTLITEKGKLIMFIKQALAYGNKSVTRSAKHEPPANTTKIVSEYNQEITQSQTSDKIMAP